MKIKPLMPLFVMAMLSGFQGKAQNNYIYKGTSLPPPGLGWNITTQVFDFPDKPNTFLISGVIGTVTTFDTDNIKHWPFGGTPAHFPSELELLTYLSGESTPAGIEAWKNAS